MKKTPEILWPALRQYRHNAEEGFVFGFDHDEVIRIFESILEQRTTQAVRKPEYRPAHVPETLYKIRTRKSRIIGGRGKGKNAGI